MKKNVIAASAKTQCTIKTTYKCHSLQIKKTWLWHMKKRKDLTCLTEKQKYVYLKIYKKTWRINQDVTWNMWLQRPQKLWLSETSGKWKSRICVAPQRDLNLIDKLNKHYNKHRYFHCATLFPPFDVWLVLYLTTRALFFCHAEL